MSSGKILGKRKSRDSVLSRSHSLGSKDAHLYAALAAAYDAATTYYSSPTEVMPAQKKRPLQAVALDPNLASAHVRLGYVRLFYDWDWPAAEQQYRRALEINPSLPEAQLGYANYLATLGHFDEALSRVQQAYLFDPLALESRKEALWIYYFSGRMPETVEQAQKTIEMEPAAGLPSCDARDAYAQMGKRPETLQAAETPFGCEQPVDNHHHGGSTRPRGPKPGGQATSQQSPGTSQGTLCLPILVAEYLCGAWRYGESV